MGGTPNGAASHERVEQRWGLQYFTLGSLVLRTRLIIEPVARYKVLCSLLSVH
jgi:hypothetical protein